MPIYRLQTYSLYYVYCCLPIFRMTFKKIIVQNVSSHKWAMYMHYVHTYYLFETYCSFVKCGGKKTLIKIGGAKKCFNVFLLVSLMPSQTLARVALSTISWVIASLLEWVVSPSSSKVTLSCLGIWVATQDVSLLLLVGYSTIGRVSQRW